MTLIHLTLAWVAGILLGSWLEPPWMVPSLLAAVMGVLLVLGRGQPRSFGCAAGPLLSPPARDGGDPSPAARVGPHLSRRLLLLGLVAAMGVLRWSLAQPSFGPGDVAFYAGQTVELRGTVVGEIENAAQGVEFPLQVEALRPAGLEWRGVRGLVLVQGGAFLEAAYGDRLVLEGTLARPPAGGRFSYRDHLARQGIYVLLRKVGAVQRLPGQGGLLPARVLYALRAWARGRLEAALLEPQASLLVGILLGSRTSIPPEVQEAFSRSGTSHILAISGWNISIVAAFLAAATRRLPRRASLLLSLTAIVLYTLLVGASAAVLRAALMGVLYVVAQQVGRPADGLTALFASGWAMTLWNPGMVWDIGFQLSFSATLGMFLFVPVWSGLWARGPAFLCESLAATFASQLLTWPIIALYFRQFSLVVPLANLLACPTLAPLMLLGTLALFLGMVPGIGILLRGLTWLLATYMLWVVGWTGGLPWASLAMPALGPLFLLLYYLGVGWWWRWWRSSGGGWR